MVRENILVIQIRDQLRGHMLQGTPTITKTPFDSHWFDKGNPLLPRPREMRSEARQPTGAFGPGIYSNTSIPRDEKEKETIMQK